MHACMFSWPTFSLWSWSLQTDSQAHNMHAQQMGVNSVCTEEEILTMRCLVLVAWFPVDMIKMFESSWLMCEDERITTLIILPPSVQTTLHTHMHTHTSKEHSGMTNSTCGKWYFIQLNNTFNYNKPTDNYRMQFITREANTQKHSLSKIKKGQIILSACRNTQVGCVVCLSCLWSMIMDDKCYCTHGCVMHHLFFPYLYFFIYE